MTQQIERSKVRRNLTDTEKAVAKLKQKWLSGADSFSLLTSGSTGHPKPISLSRKILRYSALTSLEFLDPNQTFKTALLCISPHYIGGMMVVIRALERHLDLVITPPSSNPLATLPGHQTFDLVSMVPLQVQTLLQEAPERLRACRNLLIGGAPLASHYLDQLRRIEGIRCFQSYGMTETASHIALKNLSAGEDYFRPLGDVQLRTDERGCLALSGTVTDHQWLQTNDVVTLKPDGRFAWKGRADFVINSGGVKVHPEAIEHQLSPLIRRPLMVCGLPDERLGEQVTLVIEGEAPATIPSFDHLPAYERPREVRYLPRFVYTESDKINRVATLALLRENQALNE